MAYDGFVPPRQLTWVGFRSRSNWDESNPFQRENTTGSDTLTDLISSGYVASIDTDRLPGGAGDASFGQLLIAIGAAAYSGVIGNFVYDTLKVAASRRRKSRDSILDMLTDQEAANLACAALAIFRYGCGLQTDMRDLRVMAVRRTGDSRHPQRWEVLIAVAPDNVNLFKVTLHEGKGRHPKIENTVARIW